MGLSKKKCLAYILLFLLYNGSVPKVRCISIEKCQSHISEKLGGYKSPVEVINYLFDNGHPINIHDPNINTHDFELMKLNQDLHGYIDDITKNVNASKENTPTIIGFCLDYATKKKLEDDTINLEEEEKSCRDEIMSFLNYTNINATRSQIFTKIFLLALDKAEFSDGLIMEFKNTIKAGAMTESAIQTVFNVDLFCMYLYTTELEFLVKVKRKIDYVNEENIPIFKRQEPRKRIRRAGPSNEA